MFAITFDLVVADAERHHPNSALQAYRDIGRTLQEFNFERIQGSVYVTENEDLANLFEAMMALRALRWLPGCMRDIRAFRMEQGSYFTAIVKGRV